MIYQFNTNKKCKINEVGGKAKALIETTNAGFPVPEGFVLSVDFFAEWMDEIKSQDTWWNLLRETTKETCDELMASVLKLKLSTTQAYMLDEYLDKLEGNVFAVRSSSPEEDLEGLSFAGMYETYLGVTKKDVEKFVLKAFSSCFDFRVMEYKGKNKISLESTAIAVIVQRQIQSEISGVGFSINPLNNSYDEVVINASFGLGEAIVSGVVTPDTYIYHAYENRIVDIEVNNKEIALHLADDGGIVKVKNHQPLAQALTDNQIIQLSKMIKDCELYYDKPIDTEWAYSEGKLYLLQARPITTYYPLLEELITEPNEDKLLYVDVIKVAQGIDENLSVLGTDVWKNIFTTSSGDMFTCGADGTLPTLNGKQYFNLFYLYKAFGRTMGNGFIYGYDPTIIDKTLKQVNEEEYKVQNYPKSTKGAKKAMAKMGLKFVGPTIKSLFGGYEKQVENYMKNYEAAVSKTDDFSVDKDFSDAVNNALEGILMVVSYSGTLMAGLMAKNKLNKMFKKHNVEAELTLLGTGLIGNPTSEMGKLMFEIASSGEFKETKSSEEFTKRIKNNSYSIDFMGTYNKYITNHGMRTFKEIDIATKRMYEDLDELYNRLKGINTEDSQMHKSKEKRKVAYEKLYKIAEINGFLNAFKKNEKVYTNTWGYREYTKYTTVTFIAKLRELALEIGKRFVEDGRLNAIDEVFDLSIDEITLAQNNSEIDLQSQREKNLEPYKKQAKLKGHPIVIDSRGKVYTPKLETKDGDLIGISIGSGVVRGRVKVLTSPYEKPINVGDILVTKSTEPSWTPIFINASGVIMEIGGPLQHGGIVAREYGIPCVSGLNGITKILKDGDLVEVDGTNGIVRKL